MKKFALLLSSIVICFTSYAQQHVTVTTWNIEHAGSRGRGLGGIGAGNLGFRTEEQLMEMAEFIKNTLKSDILAVQEIALNDIVYDIKINRELDLLIEYLGEGWNYVIGSSGGDALIGEQEGNMQNAFIWNANKVRLIRHFDLELPNINIGERAFDRLPLAGYFEAIDPNKPNRTDFLLVNLHMKSGQDNDENHLAAMVIVEQNLRFFLRKNEVKESDIVILGDFNDNPYDPRYTDFLYQYMAYKGYVNLTTQETGATRMDANLTSIIDHILVNSSMQRELKAIKAEKYMPGMNIDELATWRKTFSDHFPVSFEIKISADNDVD